MSREKGPSNVYFIKPIGMEGPIKIGFSDVPLNRLINLGAWSPLPLEIIGTVPGSRKDESFLHASFSSAYSHREWFHPTLPLLEAIKRILAAGSIEAVRETLPPCGKIPRKARKAVTDSVKLRRSYEARIRHCTRKLRSEDPKTGWHEPHDVEGIISRWCGDFRTPEMYPSDAEIARIEQYLAAPKAQSIIPRWMLPKDSICVPIFLSDEEMAG